MIEASAGGLNNVREEGRQWPLDLFLVAVHRCGLTVGRGPQQHDLRLAGEVQKVRDDRHRRVVGNTDRPIRFACEGLRVTMFGLASMGQANYCNHQPGGRPGSADAHGVGPTRW